MPTPNNRNSIKHTALAPLSQSFFPRHANIGPSRTTTTFHHYCTINHKLPKPRLPPLPPGWWVGGGCRRPSAARGLAGLMLRVSRWKANTHVE
jgi:hypothetical protein